MSDEFSQNGVPGEVITQTVLSDKSKVVAALFCYAFSQDGLVCTESILDVQGQAF